MHVKINIVDVAPIPGHEAVICQPGNTVSVSRTVLLQVKQPGTKFHIELDNLTQTPIRCVKNACSIKVRKIRLN